MFAATDGRRGVRLAPKLRRPLASAPLVLVLLALGLLGLGAVGRAVAQPISAQQAPTTEQEAAPEPTLVPPQLLQFVEAEYPEAAVAEGRSGTVELELVVGPDGGVQEASVVTPVAPDLDAAALAAGRQLRFRPATRDGEPIPARIRFPYVFELAEAPVEEAPNEPPPPADLEGQVLSAEDDAPIRGANVTLSGAALPEASVLVTDEQGRFAFRGLPAGTYTAEVVAAGYDSRFQEEQLLAGQATMVVYRLREAEDESAYGAVARIPPPPREVTRRSINRTQLTRIPGTRGDALRAVELQPGVARPPVGAGVLIVRGSSPQDTEVQLEGLPIPLLYHFGGLTSVFNSQLLQSVEFFPGNFSVKYGRRRGGIIEANVRDPAGDQLHGLLDINLVDTYAILEGPITDDWAFAIAGRRSYVDLILSEAIGDDVSLLAAPVYYDYQAITTYRADDNNRFRLMLFGSSDKFALLFDNPPDDDADFTGIDLRTAFHRAHASWYANLSDTVEQDVELAIEHLQLRFAAGSAVSFQLSGFQGFGRSEWRVRLNENVRLIGGLDMRVFPGKVRYEGPEVQQGEGNGGGGPGGADRDTGNISTDTNFTQADPGIYLETDLYFDPVRVVLGSRFDYYNLTGEVSYDPRVTFVYNATDRTTLKAGVGMFSQPPQPQETDAVLGTPDLKPTRTLHTTAGGDHDFGNGVSLGVEGFYKHLWDRVVATDTGDPRFINGGDGRVYGLEVAGKVEPRGRFFGYLSYTLQRSERRDLDGRWRLFDFDQPHILTVAGVYRLGAGWELGATFRLVSGNPYTPVVDGVLDQNSATFIPTLGAINSARNPAFHRLDVLVRKTWEFDVWKLIVYLDVQNVYNRMNPEGLVYDYRFQESQTLPGLPIIPNLGVRGEF